MKNAFVFAVLIHLFLSCQSGQNSNAQSQSTDEVHKVTVKEVFQASNYTYLLVIENTTENWLAVPKMMATPGETYYYRNGARMTNFESKDLGKKFETIYFLESLNKTPNLSIPDTVANPHKTMQINSDTSTLVQYSAKVVVKKEEVNIQHAEKTITIAEILSNKEKYKDKTVRVTGKVTKFNAKIMNRNWIHIQDGTESNGKFDLTATTDMEVTVGNIIILEGTLALNKEFGYGYSYEVLLEDAKIVSK